MMWVSIRVCGLSAGSRSVSSLSSPQMETLSSWTIMSAPKSKYLFRDSCIIFYYSTTFNTNLETIIQSSIVDLW